MHVIIFKDNYNLNKIEKLVPTLPYLMDLSINLNPIYLYHFYNK